MPKNCKHLINDDFRPLGILHNKLDTEGDLEVLSDTSSFFWFQLRHDNSDLGNLWWPLPNSSQFAHYYKCHG